MKLLGIVMTLWPFAYMVWAWVMPEQWKRVFSVVRPVPQRNQFLWSAWLIAITLFTWAWIGFFVWNGLDIIEGAVPRSWGSHNEDGEWVSTGSEFRQWVAIGLGTLFMFATEKLNSGALSARFPKAE